MGRRTRVYKRQELYELVWSRPMYQAAKHYGVSDVSLRKTCLKLAVPLPDRGHWSRIAAGHEIVRPALPASNGLTELHVDWWEDETAAALVPSERASDQSRAASENAIEVPQKLTKPHPLVAHTSKRLSGLRATDGVLPQLGGCLSVAVSPENVQRALRIMDALIKALDTSGHRVVVEDVPVHNDRWRPPETRCATFVCLDGEKIEFALTEPVNLVPLPPSLTDKERRSRAPDKVGRPRLPSGNLCLTIREGATHRHWRDRTHRKLESFLPEFIAHLYIVADWLKQARAAVAERQRREEEARQQRIRQAERAAEEERRIEDLHARLECWRLARDLRAYAADIRATVCMSNAEVGRNDEVARHLELAVTYAARIDPLTTLRRELAEGANQPTE